MEKVQVAEQFFSVQGEGPHSGTPAVFLRLAGCNLCCGGRDNLDRDPEDFEAEENATWVCDTIDVWRQHDAVYSAEELVDEWEARGWLDALSGNSHLVLTGGEPTLPRHQKAFFNLITELLDERDVSPYVEVETNGTIKPKRTFGAYVHQYNVSLKLSNSGMSYDERIKPEAIEFYKTVHEETSDGAVFKFVVSTEKDVAEIKDIIEDFDIPDSMVTLMPAGQTRKQLRHRYSKVAELAMENDWNFSPRLQVDAWNQATGV